MSKSRSEQKYEELKAYYKEKASAKEKELHMDLLAVRHEYIPHHLKRKFLTGVGIFGSVYLVEKLIFGKKLPRIIRFTTSLSAIVFAPKVYRILEDKFLGLGELEPLEMEMLEDQQLSSDAVADTERAVANDPYAPDENEGTTSTITRPLGAPIEPKSATSIAEDVPPPPDAPPEQTYEKDIPSPPADTGHAGEDSDPDNDKLK